MRTPLVIGNWKMHGTLVEARALAGALRDGLKRPRGVQVVVCPPFTSLAAVSEILTGGPIQLAASQRFGDAWSISFGLKCSLSLWRTKSTLRSLKVISFSRSASTPCSTISAKMIS